MELKFSPPPECRLNDPRPTREYLVQYNETNLQFIDRILAEEGIFYFWEYTENTAKLILTDHSLLFATPIADAIEYNVSV